MTYIHKRLLERGLLRDLLPEEDDLGLDVESIEAAREDIKAREEEERIKRLEAKRAVARLQELNSRNHYGESLRRAFGGR